jgi:hypothetical protein
MLFTLHTAAGLQHSISKHPKLGELKFCNYLRGQLIYLETYWRKVLGIMDDCIA